MQTRKGALCSWARGSSSIGQDVSVWEGQGGSGEGRKQGLGEWLIDPQQCD
jgi:hypothetical protein